MSAWVNYTAIVKILVFSLLVGAALPALFAVGVRMRAAGPDGSPRHPVLAVLSWLIFAVVLAAIVIAVLFIARDFIAHRTGWHVLGA